MTIDDELLLELFKPDIHGKVGDNALIVKIVGTRRIKYSLEESVNSKALPNLEKATPDILITLLDEKHKEVAIELENDIHWDFGIFWDMETWQASKWASFHGYFRLVLGFFPENTSAF